MPEEKDAWIMKSNMSRGVERVHRHVHGGDVLHSEAFLDELDDHLDLPAFACVVGIRQRHGRVVGDDVSLVVVWNIGRVCHVKWENFEGGPS